MHLPYPARLNADTALEFEIITMAEPTSVNNAQFASRLRGLRDKKCFAKEQILIETTSRSKGIKDFTLDVNVSSIPLANLYLAEWRDKNQVDLIRLAGG